MPAPRWPIAAFWSAEKRRPRTSIRIAATLEDRACRRWPTQQPALGRFVYFLNMQGIAPEKVSDVHASAYLEALKINEISKSPDVAYRAAVNGWNLATRRLPEWPQQQLTLPSRRKRIALPLEDYPESFQADLEAFLYALAHPDPLAERADSHPRRRRPSRNTTTD